MSRRFKPREFASAKVHFAKKRARRARGAGDRAVMRIAAARPLWRDEVTVVSPNRMFSRRALRGLRGHVQRAAHGSPELLERLADSRIEGVRSWEYGMVLGFLRGFPERRGWQALDVGSGNSAFPGYLLETGNVGRITTLDLPDPFEGRDVGVAQRRAGIERVHASMLEMPFEDDSFDFVTCISAIEHLDGQPLLHRYHPDEHRQLPYEEYLERTRTALREMVRVVKPGGHVFVTTDAYVPERQRTDACFTPDGGGPIWSAYRFEDIEAVFVQTVRDAGARLVGTPEYELEALLADSDLGTWRGRYFTTFAVVARKEAGA